MKGKILMKIKKKGYGILKAATILFTVMAISTLIPQSSVSKPCMLGYMAHCTWIPISTVICFALAGIICSIRRKKFTEKG